jgi:hypothetical protein
MSQHRETRYEVANGQAPEGADPDETKGRWLAEQIVFVDHDGLRLSCGAARPSSFQPRQPQRLKDDKASRRYVSGA